MSHEIQDSAVLVTGGAGFIGSNLVERLLQQGNKVTCLDNFATGLRDNIKSFHSYSNFSLIEGDIRNQETCHEACEGITYVFHHAALGSVPRSIEDPATSAEVNEIGFLKMLIAARDAQVKRFVYAASSSTYGDSSTLPKIEHRIGKPLSPYAITKLSNELYAENFNRLFGLETIGLRYFNVFGRRQDPQAAYAAVIPKFCSMLLDHKSPTIYGDGTHSRDFTHIENVLQVNQLSALVNDPDAVNQVYNVACGERTDLNRMAQILKAELSMFDPNIDRVEIKHGPSRKGDIPHSHADISKAQGLLGYKPIVKFEEGIKAAADWYFKTLSTS